MMNLDSMNVFADISDRDAATASDADEPGFGCLETAYGGLPLQRLGVNGRITGLLYRLVVSQQFVNSHAVPLEATYIFPLPARAGVTRFRLWVGERLIEGLLKERGAARADYDQAIREGHRAAIAEEERPEVFTVRAGNIPPGEAVRVELELAGPLAFADGEATFRFPLVVAPRYIPGVALDGPVVGQGTAWDTDAVPDASRISPPVLLPGQPNPVHLSFRMELDAAGLALSDLRASLHRLQLRQVEPDQRVVELAPGTERLDRDVILRFRVGGEDIQSSLNLYHHPDGETTALLTVVPPASLPDALRPRDVVIVLDRSGSMEGWKMAAARRAAGRLLDTLTERDRFGVLLFDDQIEEPAPSAGQLIRATDRNRFRAVEFLARVDARGGTEIAPALHRALQYFPDAPDPARERIVLFITDGQVGNEDQLLRQVQQQAQHCRMFTVGIDQAVNASLLERLARYGGGHCELVESEDRLDAVLRSVHRRLGAPLLTDLRLEPALEDQAPETVDLFPGVPVRLGGRLPSALPPSITVTARTATGQPFEQVLIPIETPDAAIRTLWARARVLDLEHRFVAQHPHDALTANEITAFSLRYGVLCRFTAFVAVDETDVVNVGGEVHRLTQAVEPPAAWATPMVACAPPPMAGFKAFAFGARSKTAIPYAALEQQEEAPTPPDSAAFPRRSIAEPPAPGSSRSGSGDSKKRAVSQKAASARSLPPWFMKLEAVLKAEESAGEPLMKVLGEALTQLDTCGDAAADLRTEGQALLKRIETGEWPSMALHQQLMAWLRRVQTLLESPPGKKWRLFWWR